MIGKVLKRNGTKMEGLGVLSKVKKLLAVSIKIDQVWSTGRSLFDPVRGMAVTLAAAVVLFGMSGCASMPKNVLFNEAMIPKASGWGQPLARNGIVDGLESTVDRLHDAIGAAPTSEMVLSKLVPVLQAVIGEASALIAAGSDVALIQDNTDVLRRSLESIGGADPRVNDTYDVIFHMDGDDPRTVRVLRAIGDLTGIYFQSKLKRGDKVMAVLPGLGGNLKTYDPWYSDPRINDKYVLGTAVYNSSADSAIQARFLAAAISDIYRRTGEKVILVGHSLAAGVVAYIIADKLVPDEMLDQVFLLSGIVGGIKSLILKGMAYDPVFRFVYAKTFGSSIVDRFNVLSPGGTVWDDPERVAAVRKRAIMVLPETEGLYGKKKDRDPLVQESLYESDQVVIVRVPDTADLHSATVEALGINAVLEWLEKPDDVGPSHRLALGQ
ncbi:MAG: hypothetical protein ABIL58_19255 [Pseudomonadota bacterium]